MFIFQLIAKFTDAEDVVSDSNHNQFYPIHYFSKAFFQNYHLFLGHAAHVIVEFPGIVDSSATIVDYSRLDNPEKKGFFLLQYWMHFSRRAGSSNCIDSRDLLSVSTYSQYIYLFWI